MRVLKFGGSSVGKPDRILSVIGILIDYTEKKIPYTVVFSAFSGVTDSLIKMAHAAAKGDESYIGLWSIFHDRHLQAIEELIQDSSHKTLIIHDFMEMSHTLKNLLQGTYLVMEASPRTMDYVLSFGERASCMIITQAMNQRGLLAEYTDARDIIKTDKNFGAARVDYALSYKLIKKKFRSSKKIKVVTGFIASAKGGLTTTLGRGGSDYTASLLGAGLKADCIEIWTDVDGVLTADPKMVDKAFTIPRLSYIEAMEMSHFGAKVIYPPTIKPAMDLGIPIAIKNTFNPGFPGSLITKEKVKHPYPVTGISSINKVSLLTLQGSGLFGVPGVAAKVFEALADQQVNVMLITQGSSESSISFAVRPEDGLSAKQGVDQAFAHEIEALTVEPVIIETDLSVVALIGENMRYTPGIAGRMFRSLGKNGVNVVAIAQGSSELNISAVINKADEAKALNALHEGLFLSETKVLHLFIVGSGLIGGTLIKQIKAQSAYLLKSKHLEIKIVGLANSRKMIFNEKGLKPETWQEELMNQGKPMKLARFIEQMKSLNLSNSIFIDNTASEAVASVYDKILDGSISISTPNKVAASSKYSKYKKLKEIADKRGVQFQYETNVGAGLPVLSTLKNLMISGDCILKIEGVLSGSLSYIFNKFTAGIRFSDLVKEAKAKGYTEPDPRDDLSLKDISRKICILAREAGYPVELEDVSLEKILSDQALKARSVEDFIKVLEKDDDRYTRLILEAEANQCKIRVIAKVEALSGDQSKCKVSVGLQQVSPDNPFYQLAGSDNMFVFTTERYLERPLVVRGPGAGAEVTAAGVFAEIVTIGDYLSGYGY
ncbi:MAG: bifunctional aspartate kinase/homoserine dehydrogenase I [Saprospiraceae bacterium]|nr:bifunctional aspartate kinase/homoserine dehydrogenase I [Saprospiraceae bacterium]